MREAIEPLADAPRALRTLQAPQHVQFDPAEDRWVVSSAAFKVQGDGTVSVDLEEVLALDGLPLTHEYPRVARAVGLVAHPVGRFRSDGYTVKHAPEPANDYHGLASGKASSTVRRTMAAECEIIVAITGDAAQRFADLALAREAQNTKSGG